MEKLKIVYLTLLHAFAAAAVFFYTSENYAIAKLDHPVPLQHAECCQGDELTAYLTSQEQHRISKRKGK